MVGAGRGDGRRSGRSGRGIGFFLEKMIPNENLLGDKNMGVLDTQAPELNEAETPLQSNEQGFPKELMTDVAYSVLDISPYRVQCCYPFASPIS